VAEPAPAHRLPRLFPGAWRKRARWCRLRADDDVLGAPECTVMSVIGWSSTAMAARYQHVIGFGVMQPTVFNHLSSSAPFLQTA
jgi:hypothetical protein